MSAFPHQCHWKILDSSNGHRLLAGWAPSIQKYIRKKSLLNDPRIGRTFRYWRCWDIDHPGICTPFIASIQISIVAACLEQWQTRKPSHVECRCNRINFNSIGNMDKADDFPTLGTIIPFRGQYSEGSWPYCHRSILCRSSSKLHRPNFDSWWIVPLASE